MPIIKTAGKVTLTSQGVTEEQIKSFVDHINKNTYKYMGMNHKKYPKKGWKLCDVMKTCMELKQIPKGVERRLESLGYSLG